MSRGYSGAFNCRSPPTKDSSGVTNPSHKGQFRHKKSGLQTPPTKDAPVLQTPPTNTRRCQNYKPLTKDAPVNQLRFKYYSAQSPLFLPKTGTVRKPGSPTVIFTENRHGWETVPTRVRGKRRGMKPCLPSSATKKGAALTPRLLY